MYRNSRRIPEKLERIIILFLMIYIAGCTSISKYNQCKEESEILQNRIRLCEFDIKELKSEIKDTKKEKTDLENIVDFYSISNYKLKSQNSKKEKEIIYLKKSNIVEVSSEILKVNKDVKNKINEVSTFIQDKYEIYPTEISLTIDEEYTDVCSYYFIKESGNRFDITIYTDLSIRASSRNNIGDVLTFSEVINNLDELDTFLNPLFKINILY